MKEKTDYKKKLIKISKKKERKEKKIPKQKEKKNVISFFFEVFSHRPCGKKAKASKTLRLVLSLDVSAELSVKFKSKLRRRSLKN